ncbi:hypothetical protein HCN44_009823 [Aphidius gifuensis]|uniref:Integrase SAM-like N-terminal domain-containing protein n=1 Tax=Aphidius gifuensis TaxID=684658 RepID=A0A834Y5A7_APHGI|nr:hypothetical protein HCN44_009823 [Aphidius gifuensis]
MSVQYPKIIPESSESESESDQDDNQTFNENDIPDDIRQQADALSKNLLPEKSKELYIQKYNEFIAWMKSRKINSMSEDVLMVYFNHLVVDTNIAPSTAWTRWSMIKSTLQQYHNVDIRNYNKLKAFVKRYQKGYKPKKSEILMAEDMKNFCEKADDRQHLADKIILIVGVFGGCRRHEIHDLKSILETTKLRKISKSFECDNSDPKQAFLVGDNVQFTKHRQWIEAKIVYLCEHKAFLTKMSLDQEGNIIKKVPVKSQKKVTSKQSEDQVCLYKKRKECIKSKETAVKEFNEKLLKQKNVLNDETTVTLEESRPSFKDLSDDDAVVNYNVDNKEEQKQNFKSLESTLPWFNITKYVTIKKGKFDAVKTINKAACNRAPKFDNLTSKNKEKNKNSVTINKSLKHQHENMIVSNTKTRQESQMPITMCSYSYQNRSSFISDIEYQSDSDYDLTPKKNHAVHENASMNLSKINHSEQCSDENEITLKNDKSGKKPEDNLQLDMAIEVGSDHSLTPKKKNMLFVIMDLSMYQK